MAQPVPELTPRTHPPLQHFLRPACGWYQHDSALPATGFLVLVADGFFSDMLLYRVIPGFLVQFGVAADPAVQAKWQNQKFADEENKVQFRAGTLSYAGAGADSRACHFFVALEPSGARLGNAKHETTIGHVEEVAVFEQVAANFQAAGCASAL